MRKMKKFLIALLFAPIMAFASGRQRAPRQVAGFGGRQGGIAERRQAVRQLLPELPRRFLHALQEPDGSGLTEQQVKDNLMFTSDKIGGLMAVAARSDEQKQWFGATPPDLTIVARARGEAGNAGAGADWLYTYLRSFYRDPNRPTGWNNVVFENVGMPQSCCGNCRASKC
jgi:ubiquinol-cytochrome c reductase cytochrome c1 subunit